MSFRLGLTGSIGMGKSTTATMFAELGCDIWDADAAVHRLYDKGGAAVSPMQTAFPGVVSGGIVSRDALKRLIDQNPRTLTEIEQIVHPLVVQDRAAFRQAAGADILVFDIPLLFETGAEADMDGVAVVSASPETQEKRVLDRKSMTRDQFLRLRQKQMPDAEKRQRADYVIITDTMDHARRQVRAIVDEIRTKIKNA